RTTLTSDGLITARNKFLALQSLRQAHIPIPRSILLASRPNFVEAAHLVRYPAILKILSGTQGIGVMRVKSLEETASIVDTLKFFGEVVCLQEYIPNPGVDIRALVVGDRVVGSMKRVAAHNEWRANIRLGAKGVAIELPDHAKEIAVRARRARVEGRRIGDQRCRHDLPWGHAVRPRGQRVTRIPRPLGRDGCERRGCNRRIRHRESQSRRAET